MTARRRQTFDRAHESLLALAATRPDAAGFAAWPGVECFVERAPRPLPAAKLVADWKTDKVDEPEPEIGAPARAAQEAIRELAPFAEWRQTYSEAEVGANFLANYGYFELIGPQGHFRSDSSRVYVAYWGPDLVYPWHLHEAEELYLIVAGTARFEAEGDEPRLLRAGGTKQHRSNQPHAMTTGALPVLALVLWRGAGLAGLPRMAGERMASRDGPSLESPGA